MEIHHIAGVGGQGRAYAEFLRTAHLSAGIYRLAAGANDPQQPHRQEEIYYIVSGRARFLAGERDVAVNAGDILFLAADEPHRFHDIEEDLEIVVVFAPPER